MAAIVIKARVGSRRALPCPHVAYLGKARAIRCDHLGRAIGGAAINDHDFHAGFKLRNDTVERFSDETGAIERGDADAEFVAHVALTIGFTPTSRCVSISSGCMMYPRRWYMATACSLSLCTRNRTADASRRRAVVSRYSIIGRPSPPARARG